MGYIKVSKAYLFFVFGLIPASVGYGLKITLFSERTVGDGCRKKDKN